MLIINSAEQLSLGFIILQLSFNKKKYSIEQNSLIFYQILGNWYETQTLNFNFYSSHFSTGTCSSFHSTAFSEANMSEF